jgi:hypothetical protein
MTGTRWQVNETAREALATLGAVHYGLAHER